MPDARSQTGIFTMNRITIVAAICILAVLVITCILFIKRAIGTASAAAALNGRPDGAVAVRYEDNPQLPAAITEAYLQPGEPYEVKHRFSKEAGDQAVPPEMVTIKRDLRLTASIINRSAHPITQLRLAVENPSFLPDQIITLICRLSGSPQRTANRNQALKPNELFVFTRKLSLEERLNDRELAKHISDFRVKVIGVSYSSGDDQIWTQSFLMDYDEEGVIEVLSLKDFSNSPRAQFLRRLQQQVPKPAPGVTPDGGQPQMAFVVSSNIYGDPKAIPRPVKDPTGYVEVPQTGDADGQATGERPQVMTAALKPTILYKPKPEYTEEARADRIQGTVVLSVVFGADGRISQIKVIRGLPDGLSEKAIEAARNIRFNPAVKNGVPVSVRGNLEFNFELDR